MDISEGSTFVASSESEELESFDEEEVLIQIGVRVLDGLQDKVDFAGLGTVDGHLLEIDLGDLPKQQILILRDYLERCLGLPESTDGEINADWKLCDMEIWWMLTRSAYYQGIPYNRRGRDTFALGN